MPPKNKQKKPKKNIFDDKRIVLVAAVLIAVISWIVIAGFINPGDSKPIFNVSIDYTYEEEKYQERDLQIVGDLTDLYVDVRVNGDGSIIAPLSNTSVMVYPDYSNITSPGTYEVPLRAAKLTSGDYVIRSYSIKTDGRALDVNEKNTVTMTFEEVERKSFSVTVKADGVSAATGFVREEPRADPGEIMITGPKNRVAQIAQVVAQVDAVDVRSERIVYSAVELLLLDENGNELDAEAMGLTLSPDVVDVDIVISEIREIGLGVNFTGIPDGFDAEWFYERINLSADSMQVTGTAAAFANIGDPMTIATFDLSQMRLGWESDPISIDLSDYAGLRNYDQLRYVIVSFDTTGLVEKTFEVPKENIVVLNGPRTATIEPIHETVSVRVIGPEDQVNALLPENIQIQVDAFNVSALASGQQAIPARILIPAANRCFAVETYSIICDITVGE